ncbi:MAG: hypothetical protein A3K90_06530 [Pelodictyon luteolum]|uniref:Uncharacterized protein n=1 Tax=Pelodictyon luteolum TaxID=1100 RepID=A0A165LRH2_PELLU|nr:hypothetical protein [Pelodictyon luteolum]KZK74336.1 MAG: hypothetical protein A3K90_06530 [Pelodictyon luteolum]
MQMIDHRTGKHLLFLCRPEHPERCGVKVGERTAGLNEYPVGSRLHNSTKARLALPESLFGLTTFRDVFSCNDLIEWLAMLVTHENNVDLDRHQRTVLAALEGLELTGATLG